MNQYWPQNHPRFLRTPHTPLIHNLQVTAQRYPDRVATWFYGHTLTYSQLLERSERLAGHLATWGGVSKGERVTIMMQNSPDWLIAAYAIWHLGGIVVPLAPMLQARELGFFLQDAGVKVGIVGAEIYSTAKQAGLAQAVVCNIMRELPQDKGGIDVPEGLDVNPELQASDCNMIQALQAMPVPQTEVNAEDIAIMPYTSGTTGLPRGCMHSHQNVQANALGAVLWGRASVEDVSLATLPFFHVTGFMNGLVAGVAAGAEMVIMSRWNRKTAHTLLKQRQITGWTSISTMLIDLLHLPEFDSQNMAHLRTVSGGGTSMPLAIAQKLKELCNVTFTEGYGLSETMAQCMANFPEHTKLGSLGIPLYGVDARVVDVESGQELPVGEVGEIIVNGPQVMQGYWQRPQENAEVFVERDGKRFLRTGDLGYCDEEGFFFFVDRLKRMVNVSGLKVWPAEVENKFHSHPAIREACVIALPDERSGEKVCILIVLKDGQQATAEELQTWAREQMSSYKVPHEYRFVESLPHSPTGKVAWRQLQEAAVTAIKAAQAEGNSN